MMVIVTKIIDSDDGGDGVADDGEDGVAAF